MKIISKDREIIQPLGEEIARIAALPVQEEKRRLWRKLNALKPERPMVMIDQVCWNEIKDKDMELRCSNRLSRLLEQHLRQIIYQWKHFPVDMVVEPYFDIPMVIRGDRLQIKVDEETSVTDPENDVISHAYKNQFVTDKDLDKIKTPKVHHNKVLSSALLYYAGKLLGGSLEVRPGAVDPYISLWDPLSTWMGVEEAMMAMMDKPDYIHELLERMTRAYMGMLDQLEEKGLLCQPQDLIHCTGAYCDELPAPGFNKKKPRTKDLWCFGLAQMFSSISPAMFKEFEIDYSKRICERFGLTYYGCCDPLDKKMNEVRQISNIRKISMSPWADQEIGASEIKGDYVFSRKPNPSLLAERDFNEKLVREELEKTRRICTEHGCPSEYILKDISTIRHDPSRLKRWAEIAMNTMGA